MNISKLRKEDFEELFSLMSHAFPPEEYRPKEKQFAILDDPDYSVTIFKENNTINAFIATWKLNGFNFAEHLAVSSNMRNRGIGSEFVKTFLKASSLPLVLEVENLSDTISLRRINFYQRLGFVLTDICYDQPNFHTTNKIIPLRIMYHSNGNQVDVGGIKKEIFEKVYKKDTPTEEQYEQ